MESKALRILICPDKFKGTLTADQAARAIGRGWNRARPGDLQDRVPISDGGDGFGAVLHRLLDANPVTVRTIDAAGRPIRAAWSWVPSKRLAIMESARVVGLARLPRGQYHPFQLDTRGLAALLRSAENLGAREALIGIGGSATNDGGFGMARALGWRFIDSEGSEIDQWTGLHRLADIVPPRQKLKLKITIAVDVQNRLLGARGCSRIYGPQKGLQPEDFPHAEKCLSQLAFVVDARIRRQSAAVPGSGAAGGLGFGFYAFCRGSLRPGFEIVARQAKFSSHLRQADVVVTGEGSLDRSTLMGKAVGEVARLCWKRNIPCLGLAGIVQSPQSLSKLFQLTLGLTRLTSSRRALSEPELWLEEAAQRLARKFGASADRL